MGLADTDIFINTDTDIFINTDADTDMIETDTSLLKSARSLSLAIYRSYDHLL